jgi:hypothetical protein
MTTPPTTLPAAMAMMAAQTGSPYTTVPRMPVATVSGRMFPANQSVKRL